ncbi:hypothetical protein JOD63_003320 [Microbacterium terrae]|uniref:Uncharacterized protein n=1 Tax=Microbacterium terrae TaxID=69369 RepID=A0A0M2HFJ2_9MICO|nr:hypothetical protein [Microbacterium terrae]KJL43028.1 hypothetical protein RS81_00992 [Microbacterium terrae]MBP1079352.1 hypothetical protein [Microbacterium terrae]GLJ98752.1 hypothetical protein GCM10017594_19490 [Microbacterium terrae]
MSPWFARSAWLWTEASAPATPAELASFAARNGVLDAWTSVPWEGPTRRTALQARALTARSVRVACLGGEPEWATDAASAAAWTRRAVTGGLFSRVHLDIEPWASAEWRRNPGALLDGLVATVRAVSAAADPIEVDIDLPAWLAREHPDAFTALLRAADGVAILAYRDRADAILADAEAAVRIAARRAKPFRIGVDTVPSAEPHTTFFDDGRDALARQSAAVAAALSGHEGFAGVAVHDLAAWRELRP